MTTELIPVGPAELTAKFERFRSSTFRLETLQSYGNSGEDAELAAFEAGELQPPPDELHRWWRRLLRAAGREGRTMRRVHVVTEPLSAYMRYELTWSYAPHVAAGEDVRIIHVAPGGRWPVGIPEQGTDYWLFDSTDLYHQHYDPDGMWLGTRFVTDPAKVALARSWGDAALRQAVPWVEYARSRPELAAGLETLAR